MISPGHVKADDIADKAREYVEARLASVAKRIELNSTPSTLMALALELQAAYLDGAMEGLEQARVILRK